MFFSRLSLKPEVGQIKLIKRMGRNKYQLHKLLWNLFDGQSIRKNQQGKELADFLYRVDHPEKELVIHLVSQRRPADHDGIWDLQERKYNLELKTGQVLQFNLRVNPTITPAKRSEKSKRHDVLMHAKLEAKQQKLDRFETWLTMREAAKAWLINPKRKEYMGCQISSEDLIVDNYRQHYVIKSRGEQVRYSSVDFQGILTITEPERFQSVLFSGIGKSKAFGCGLMLIKQI